MGENGRNFFKYRKSLYASINGRVGNFVKLSKSNLLRNNEKEKLKEVIQKIRELSSIIKQNNKPPNFGKIKIMTDIEIMKYFINHDRFYGDVTFNSANEIIAKTFDNENHFSFDLFLKIKEKIGRDFTIKYNRIDGNFELIVKCKE